ncbi:hypothetical protein GLYMA_07G216651v4 [Glycine max]|nr:hypothetical protein GLYMA_07G216651v4 [Glycine max]KAH1087969.1 hypothetical protein GYH30_019170 [Glycine max]
MEWLACGFHMMLSLFFVFRTTLSDILSCLSSCLCGMISCANGCDVV